MSSFKGSLTFFFFFLIFDRQEKKKKKKKEKLLHPFLCFHFLFSLSVFLSFPSGTGRSPDRYTHVPMPHTHARAHAHRLGENFPPHIFLSFVFSHAQNVLLASREVDLHIVEGRVPKENQNPKKKKT